MIVSTSEPRRRTPSGHSLPFWQDMSDHWRVEARFVVAWGAMLGQAAHFDGDVCGEHVNKLVNHFILFFGIADCFQRKPR